jgi:protease-4
MDEATVRELADGRVCTGEQALELGLIDEIGYFDDAIAKAAELGGISGEPRVVELQPEQDFLSMLYGVGGQAHDQASLAAVLELLKMVAAPTLEFRYVSP